MNKDNKGSNDGYKTMMMDLIERSYKLRKDDPATFQQVLRATWTSNMRTIQNASLEKLQIYGIVHFDPASGHYMPIAVMEWGRYFGAEYAEDPLTPPHPGVQQPMKKIQSVCFEDVMAVRELDRVARLDKPTKLKHYDVLNRFMLLRGTEDDPTVGVTVRAFFQKFDAPAESITWSGPVYKR
jgi:hypothetical protein